ncbi:MAG: hypothetical protein HQK86_04250 [Nitrospinae bacterium]|nr:hypothetical protein [Nitrospinota bacterium]
MPDITEGKLTFKFPSKWQVAKYDDWSFYRNQFQRIDGTKGVDILAIDTDKCIWAIEVKDYRQHLRSKVIDLPGEVACKARNTLAGLFAAHVNANDADEKRFAGDALVSKRIRVVLHLEQPSKHSKLFPRAIDPADIKQKLKQLLKAIDPHPDVIEIGRMGTVAWKAR